jgi:steroid delta-isomerase-like uncharacterized protein
MSTEDNKVIMRRFYEEVMNQNNLAVIDDFLAPNFVNHSALQLGMQGGGIEEVKQYLSMILTTFPDLHYTVEDMIAEGDKVIARLTVSGTQQGAFLGIPPTGKHATVTDIEIVRIANGKFVEIWVQVDFLGLLQQLGVVPAPGQAS